MGPNQRPFVGLKTASGWNNRSEIKAHLKVRPFKSKGEGRSKTKIRRSIQKLRANR